MIRLSETVLLYHGVPIRDSSFIPVYVTVFVPGTLVPARTPYRNGAYAKERDVDATEESSCFYAGRRSPYMYMRGEDKEREREEE